MLQEESADGVVSDAHLQVRRAYAIGLHLQVLTIDPGEGWLEALPSYAQA